LEALAIAARDPELAAPARTRPAQAVDEVNGVGLAPRSGGTRPMTDGSPWRRFDQNRVCRIKGRVHDAAIRTFREFGLWVDEPHVSSIDTLADCRNRI